MEKFFVWDVVWQQRLGLMVADKKTTEQMAGEVNEQIAFLNKTADVDTKKVTAADVEKALSEFGHVKNTTANTAALPDREKHHVLLVAKESRGYSCTISLPYVNLLNNTPDDEPSLASRYTEAQI